MHSCSHSNRWQLPSAYFLVMFSILASSQKCQTLPSYNSSCLYTQIHCDIFFFLAPSLCWVGSHVLLTCVQWNDVVHWFSWLVKRCFKLTNIIFVTMAELKGNQKCICFPPVTTVGFFFWNNVPREYLFSAWGKFTNTTLHEFIIVS